MSDYSNYPSNVSENSFSNYSSSTSNIVTKTFVKTAQPFSVPRTNEKNLKNISETYKDLHIELEKWLSESKATILHFAVANTPVEGFSNYTDNNVTETLFIYCQISVVAKIEDSKD